MKKMIALLLIICLLTVGLLCGCSSESKNSNEVSQQASVNEKNDKPQIPLEDITWDSNEISWKKDTSPITLSCFINFTWYPLDKWGNDDVSKEITKRTGISLDVTKAANNQQLQVMLAAAELPDLVFGAGNIMKRFEDPMKSYAFDELIKKYCPEFLNLIDPVEIANNTVDDGHFYSLKTHYKNDEVWKDPRDIPSVGDVGTFYREDIYKELGSPALENIEDFEKLLFMVKDKYPDMVPLIVRPNYSNSIVEWFGLTMMPQVYDGKVIKGISNPMFKDYYKYFNKLFREELISAESLTYQLEQYKQIRNSGKVFCFMDDTLRGDEANKFFDDNGIKGHYVPMMKPLKVNGEIKYNPVDRGIGWANCYITKKCKDPKKAILYMEFLKSPEGDALTQWGIEGKHYTLNEDSVIIRPEGFDDWSVKQTGIFPWYFMASGFGESLKYYSDKVAKPKYSQYVDLLVEIKKYYTRDPALYFVEPNPDTDEYDISSEIATLIHNSDLQILSAPTEEEAMQLYDKLMDDLKRTGIEQLEDYYNKAYEKAKERYKNIK